MDQPFTTLHALSEARRQLSGLRSRLFQVLLIPVSLEVLLGLLVMVDQPVAVGAIVRLVSLLVHVVVAISIHRLVLVGSDAMPKWGLQRWGGRETRFLFYSIGFAAPFVGTTYLVGLNVPFVLIGVLFVVLVWVASRLSLVLPGTAVGADCSLADSWALTKPHQATIMMAAYIIPLGMLIVFGLVAGLVSFLHVGAAIVAYSFLAIVANVLGITILSLAYRNIVDNAQDLDK